MEITKMIIRRKCKFCKAIIPRRHTAGYKQSNQYCLTCGFKRYKEECREERRIALGLK